MEPALLALACTKEYNDYRWLQHQALHECRGKSLHSRPELDGADDVVALLVGLDPVVAEHQVNGAPLVGLAAPQPGFVVGAEARDRDGGVGEKRPCFGPGLLATGLHHDVGD